MTPSGLLEQSLRPCQVWQGRFAERHVSHAAAVRVETLSLIGSQERTLLMRIIRNWATSSLKGSPSETNRRGGGCDSAACVTFGLIGKWHKIIDESAAAYDHPG